MWELREGMVPMMVLVVVSGACAEFAQERCTDGATRSRFGCGDDGRGWWIDRCLGGLWVRSPQCYVTEDDGPAGNSDDDGDDGLAGNSDDDGDDGLAGNSDDDGDDGLAGNSDDDGDDGPAGNSDDDDGTDCPPSSVLVAVGYQDQIFRSIDGGRSWKQASVNGERGNLEDVVHAGGTWVAGDPFFEAWIRSADSETWTVVLQDIWPDANTGVQAVGHGGGLWLVGSEHGKLAISTDDAMTFTSKGAPSGWKAGKALEDIAYHDGQFVVVGDAGQISVTSDPRSAQNWTTHTPTTADLKRVLHADGVWVTVGFDGTCLYSDDGASSWKACNVPATGGHFYGLHHSAEQWVIGASSVPGQVILGTSHQTGWIAHPFPGTDQAVFSVYRDCSSSRLLAAGIDVGRSSKDRGFIAASDDGGRTWTKLVDCAGPIQDIAGD